MYTAAYNMEAAELLKDCSQNETAILLDMMSSMKQIMQKEMSDPVGHLDHTVSLILRAATTAAGITKR